VQKSIKCEAPNGKVAALTVAGPWMESKKDFSLRSK
jgi:hypothetical protein